MKPITDFAVFDDLQMVEMLHAGKPHTLRGVAQMWGAVFVSLHERADEMERDLRTARSAWSGDSADQYEVAISALVESIRKVAEMASLLRDLVFSVSEWLDQAQAMVPKPNTSAPVPTGVTPAPTNGQRGFV